MPQKRNSSSIEMNNLKSLRTLSAISIIAGAWSMIFEVYYFREFDLGIYFARLFFTIVGFMVFILSSKTLSKPITNLLIHIFIVTLIGSFVYTMYKIPSTIFINSQILSLLIFTTAIVFSWEINNQIIVAIYYNVLFASSILFNDVNVFQLPNLFSLVLFVCLISLLSVVASVVNYNLRKSYAIKLEEINFLFNSAPVGICRTDIEGHIITSNYYMNNLFGVNERLRHVKITDYLNNEDFIKYFQRVSSGLVESVECNLNYISQDNKSLFLKVIGKVITDESEIDSLEFIFRDDTKEILAIREREEITQKLLNETREKERNAERALFEKNQKIEFLAKINHEVRTPLSSILIYLEMLDDESMNLPEDVKKFSGSIKVAAQSLMNTINNFLDFAKMDTGNLKVENEVFSLGKEMDKVEQLVSPLAHSNNDSLQFNKDGIETDIVFSDVSKYRQIIVNLVANAVKFTKDGKITVTVNNKNIKDDQYELTSIIEDTGVGIPEELIKSIFEPFVALNDGIKYNVSSGLGLTICRELINLLNGDIVVESRVGKGTKFIVKIPFTYNPGINKAP